MEGRPFRPVVSSYEERISDWASVVLSWLYTTPWAVREWPRRLLEDASVIGLQCQKAVQWRLRFHLVKRIRLSQVGFSDHKIDISGTLLEGPGSRRIRSQRHDMTLIHHYTAYSHPSLKSPSLTEVFTILCPQTLWQICVPQITGRSLPNWNPSNLSAYHLQSSSVDEVSFPPHSHL